MSGHDHVYDDDLPRLSRDYGGSPGTDIAAIKS
jgi:hypothetical protein